MHVRIAGAIKQARGKRSAQWLADRTVDLGYPITRAQIANYESGRKQSLDTAELIVLAAALNTSPANLIYPGPYQDIVEVLPGREGSEFDAVQWFSGLEWHNFTKLDNDDLSPDEWNTATKTLRLWRLLAERRMERNKARFRMVKENTIRDDDSRQLLAVYDTMIEDLQQQLEDLQQQLGISDDA